MNETITEDQYFQQIDFSNILFAKGDYDNCNFDHCIFSNLDLSDTNFVECKFSNCDLSLVKTINTAFRDVIFEDCKLLGFNLESCNKFGLSVHFERCYLNMSSFNKLNLKNTRFIECSLQEVDFNESNLTGVIFDRCDLSRARFRNTILEKSDFRTSYNFSIDPEINRLKKAKFSINGVAGLLDKYKIEIE